MKKDFKNKLIENAMDISNKITIDPTVCANCKKHKSNGIPWVGEGGIMGFVHGMYSYWCDCCSLEAQVKYAEKQAKQLSDLKEKLGKVKCIGVK